MSYWLLLLDLMVREARGCIEEGVVKSAEDIDFAMRLGTGFPASHGGLTLWAAAITSIDVPEDQVADKTKTKREP